jgi:hypothetical protein
MNNTPWHSRPIFITSTFRDMQAERDYLRSHVFPELEEELRSRRIFLEPIDLRWGVETVSTEEAFQAGLAIREQLAARDPGNAQWQRDLVLSLNNLANVYNAKKEHDETNRWRRRCHQQLRYMKEAGMHLDESLVKLCEWLDGNLDQ